MEHIKSLRYNTGKPQWSLVHFKSLEPLVQVLEYGKKKYTTDTASGRDNWKLGLDLDEILDSMQRHLAALIDGEETDKESGLKHIGHIMANCMLYEYHKNKQNE